MLSFFPTPYPDELMYSIFARYHKKSGNISYFHTIEELFGTKAAIAVVDFPSRLTYLTEQISMESKFIPEYFIYNHTIFPLFKPFIFDDKAQKVIEDMKGNNGKVIHMRLGVMAGGICKTKSLKVCTKCAEEDMMNYGEIYLHRVHNVPGNYVCLKHNMFLKQYPIPKDKNYAEYVNVNDIIQDTQSMIREDTHIKDEFMKLANDIALVFSNTFREFNLEQVQQKYYFMLSKQNYISPKGIVKHKELYSHFTKFYSFGFLDHLESSIDINDGECWLRRIAVRDRQVIHPIRHLLFIRFLFGGIKEFYKSKNEEYHPFGKSPWPCLNPVAEHYLNTRIDKCEISTDSKTGRPVGKFICECGFIYSRRGPDKREEDRYRIGNKKQFGHIWEERLSRMVVDEKLSITRLSDELHCDSKTVIKYADKLGIRDLINSKTKPYSDKKRLSYYDETLEEPYKKDIQMLIDEEPNLSRSRIMKTLSKQYSWLYKYRKEWMEEILPKPILDANINRFSKNIVDWERRDEELYEKVSCAIEEILNEQIPKQVSLSLISKKIDYSPLYEKLNKFPKTKQLIDKYCESTEKFQIRRLDKVTNDLLIQGSTITKSKLIKLAGLKCRTERVHNLIIKAVKEYNERQ